MPGARSRIPLSAPQKLSDRVLPVSHCSILPRNLPLLQAVEPLPSRNITTTGGGSRGQQDGPGGSRPAQSVPLSPYGRAGAADSCHQPTCGVSHSITVSDLLPGKGPQVKPSISAASLALALGAPSIPCLPTGTAAAAAQFLVGPLRGSARPHATPSPPGQSHQLAPAAAQGSPSRVWIRLVCMQGHTVPSPRTEHSPPHARWGWSWRRNQTGTAAAMLRAGAPAFMAPGLRHPQVPNVPSWGEQEQHGWDTNPLAAPQSPQQQC